MRLSSKLTGNVSVAVTACENATTVETAIANAERADGADRNRADDTATGFIAIDPEGAKDRDDAVWAKRLDAGRWHVKVAVADVGAYVQAGSPLDAAVRERAQSIYLVNECIHMCSEMLSSEICSLHEGRRKRALVTEFTVHEHAGVRPIRAMDPAWIAIDRAISYEDAKAQIDADAYETLAAIDGCAQALRRARRARGAIVLECSDEIAMVADAHAAQPRPVRRIAHRAHHLIEEMMIAANVVNARWLDAHAAGGAVYRTHPDPGPDKGFVVSDHAWTWRISLDKGDSIREWMQAILASNSASQRLRELAVKQGMEKAASTCQPVCGAMPWTSPRVRTVPLLPRRAAARSLSILPLAFDAFHRQQPHPGDRAVACSRPVRLLVGHRTG